MCVASQFEPLFAQTPTATFTYPSNNATGVPLRPLIKLQTQYRIDTSSIYRHIHDLDSLDPAKPTIMLVPKMLADSFPEAVKYSSIRGSYSFSNDTTIVFQPYQELAPLTTYCAIVGSLNVLVPLYPAGYDTVATSTDTLSITTTNHAYRMLFASFASGLVHCNDTFSVFFNRKLQSATSPLDSSLIELAKLDSIEYVNDSTSIKHFTVLPMTVWVDSDSTRLWALPDSALHSEETYFVTVKMGELTGEPNDNRTSIVKQVEYYQVKTSVAPADTSYFVPSYCKVLSAKETYYGLGDTVRLSASADSNFMFLRWSAPDIPAIDSSRNPSIMIEPIEDCRYLQSYEVTAVFVRKDTVTVTVQEDSVYCSVSVYDAQDNYLGGAGTYQLPPDSSLYTVAIPDTNYLFEGWYMLDSNGDTIKSPSALTGRNRIDWGNEGFNYIIGPGLTGGGPCEDSKICVKIIASGDGGTTCEMEGSRRGKNSPRQVDQSKLTSSYYYNPNEFVNVYIDGTLQSEACTTVVGERNHLFHVVVEVKDAYRSCWALSGVYKGKNAMSLDPDFESGSSYVYVYDEYVVGPCPNEEFTLFVHLLPKEKTLYVKTTIQDPGTIEAVGDFNKYGGTSKDDTPTEGNKEITVRVYKTCYNDGAPIWVEITQNVSDGDGYQEFTLPCYAPVYVEIDWEGKNSGPVNNDWEFVKWTCSVPAPCGTASSKYEYPYNPKGCPTTVTNPGAANYHYHGFSIDPCSTITGIYVEAIVKENFRLSQVGLWENNKPKTSPPTYYRVRQLRMAERSDEPRSDLNIIQEPSEKGGEVVFRFSHPVDRNYVNNSTNILCHDLSPRIDWLTVGTPGWSPDGMNYSPNTSLTGQTQYSNNDRDVRLKLQRMKEGSLNGIPHAERFMATVSNGIHRPSPFNAQTLDQTYKFQFETEMPGLTCFVKEVTPLEESDEFLGIGEENVELYSLADFYYYPSSREEAQISYKWVTNGSQANSYPHNGVCYEWTPPGTTRTLYGNNGRVFTSDKMRKPALVSLELSSWDFDGDAWDCSSPDAQSVIDHHIQEAITIGIIAGILAMIGVMLLPPSWTGVYAGSILGSRVLAAIWSYFLPIAAFGLAGFAAAAIYAAALQPDLLGKTVWGSYSWFDSNFGAYPGMSPKSSDPITNDIVKHKTEFKLKRDSYP